MAEKKSERQEEKGRGVAAWRPFSGLDPWAGFGDPFPSRLGWLTDELFRRGRSTGYACVPAMDVSEDDHAYSLTMELPGTSRDDVHLDLHEGVLTIRGEKKSEREERKEHRRYVERSYGSFSRSFHLPPDADGEHVEASFKEGVLTVSIPKTAEAKPRTVSIKAG